MIESAKKRAALYLRQSLDRAEGIENQHKRCAALAEAKGWQVVAVFRDNEVRASSARGEGTAWHDMLGRIGRDFEVIIAVDLDRLVRSTKDLNTLIGLGAQLVTANGDIDLVGAEGKFRATMIAALANFETDRASERQKRHKAGKAERGEWHGGPAPYGYRLEGGKPVPADEEVALIREAVKRLLNDREPLHSIVTDWNSPTTPGGSDIRKPNRSGGHWRQSNLRRMLMNRSLLGETPAGVVGWEPILDQKTHERLVLLLTDPSRNTTTTTGIKGDSKYTLGGLAVCGVCGKAMTPTLKTLRGGAKVATVACLKRVQGPHPAHPQVEVEVTRGGKKVTEWQDTNRVAINHDRVETYVFEQIIDALNRTDRWRQRLTESDPDAEAEIDRLEAERSALRDQRKRAANSYVVGLMSELDAKATGERIASELEGLERKINNLLGRPTVDDRDLEGVVNWKDWTPGRRRAFLRVFIDQVVILPWPEGMKRTPPKWRWKGESEEDYITRRERDALEVIAKRVRIVWRWDHK